MPIIPVGNEQTRLQMNTPVPIGSPNDARIQGASFQAMGKGLENAGIDIQRQILAQEQAQRVLEHEKAASDIQAIVARHEAETKLTQSEDYVKDFAMKSQPEVNDYINNIKDPQLRDSISAYAHKQQMAGQVAMFNHQLHENRLKILDGTQESVKSAAMRAYNDPGNMGMHFDTWEKEVLGPLSQGNNLLPEDVMKLKDAAKQEIAQGAFQGMIDRKQYGPAKEWLSSVHKDFAQGQFDMEMDPQKAFDLHLIDEKQMAELNSKGESYRHPTLTTKGQEVPKEIARMLDGLPSEKRIRLLEQIQERAKADQMVKISDFERSFADFKVAAANGPIDPKEEIRMHNLVSRINATPEQQQRLHNEISQSMKVGETVQKMATAPIDQISKLIDQAVPQSNQVEGAASREHARQMMESAARKILKARYDDPAGFVQSKFPEIQDLYKQAADGNPASTQKAVAGSIAMQKSLGMGADDVKVLPDGIADRMTSTIAGAGSAEGKALVINSLKMQYGDYFPQVMHELEKRDASLKSMAVVAYTNDSASQAMVLNALTNKAKITQTFNQHPSTLNGGFQHKDVDGRIAGAVGLYLSALQSNFPNGSAAELADGLHDAVAAETKNRLAQRDSYDLKDAELVANQVTEAVIGKNFTVANAGNSRLLIPKNFDDTRISGVLRQMNTPGGMRTLGVAIPEDIQDKDGYFNRLARDSRWVLNNRMDGVNLVMEANGRMVPVVDAKNKPITKTFPELESTRLFVPAMSDKEAKSLNKLNAGQGMYR